MLALASALAYGSSDYAAEVAARWASVIRITVLADAVALLTLLLMVPMVSTWPPSLASAAWAAASGLGGFSGAMALYAGFRHAAFSRAHR